MWGDAEREILRWQQAKAPQQTERPASTVTAAVEKYLTHCKVESNVAFSTELSYKKTLEHFTNFLQIAGKNHVGEIDVDCIRGYLATRADYTPRTRRKELEHIRFFLWFCFDNDWIPKNPATATGKRGVRVKVPTGGASQPFTDDEINTLLDACEQIDNPNKKYVARARLRAQALILGMCYTGFRISDMMSLKRSEVSRDGGVEDHIMVKTKNLVWTRFGELALKALLALPQESEYFLWSGPDKSKLTTATGSARRTLYALQRATKINVHPRRFRATFAKKVLDDTGDIRVLQHLLGHTSLKTTEDSYAYLGPKHKERLTDALSQIKYAKRDGTTGQVIEFPSSTDRD